MSESDILKSALLFVLAGISEIGGAYLLWQALREGGGVWLAILGGFLLVCYGAVVTLQPDVHFGRVLAAYGGVFHRGLLGVGSYFRSVSPGSLRHLRGGRMSYRRWFGHVCPKRDRLTATARLTRLDHPGDWE